MLDAHVHTRFSADSEADPTLYVEEALRKGITHLTFTDHTDLHYPHDLHFEFNIHDYQIMFDALQKKYGHRLHLYKGIELGLQKNCILDSEILIESFNPDFVICSLHTVDGEDLYYGNYFKKHSPEEALRHYFTTLRDIVDRFSNFNVLGHLDLPKRYAPELYHVPVNRYMTIIDEIFDILFSREQGIEINASGLRSPLKKPFPDYEIIAHYIKRGGKILTFGSDSHQEDTLGQGYDLIKAFLESQNIHHLYAFKDMKPLTVKI